MLAREVFEAGWQFWLLDGRVLIILKMPFVLGNSLRLWAIWLQTPRVRKIPQRRKWQPTPVLLPGKAHGWRSLVGYSL